MCINQVDFDRCARGVLISSQTRSQIRGLGESEAGVLFGHRGICSYFTKIFESDWSTALRQLPGGAPEALAPEALREGSFIRVEPGDYREV